jgi:hypothetical protein
MRTLIEQLDFIINSEETSAIVPLAQYVRSRSLPGREAPAPVEPFFLTLLKVKPDSTEGILLSLLKAYMDEHPEDFSKIEVS